MYGGRDSSQHDPSGHQNMFSAGEGETYLNNEGMTGAGGSSPSRRPLATKRTHRPSPAYSPSSDLYLHSLTTNAMSKKMDVRPSPVWLHNEHGGVGLSHEDTGFSNRPDMHEMFSASQRAFAARFSENNGTFSNVNPDVPGSFSEGNKDQMPYFDPSQFEAMMLAAAAAQHNHQQQQQQMHAAASEYDGAISQAEMLMTPSKMATAAGAGSTGKKRRSGKKAVSKNLGGGGGRWTKEEDQRLRAAVASVGPQNWKLIANDYLNDSRSDVQCLHRWQKVLQPGLVKGPWTKEEDQIIVDCIEVGIVKWSEIAERIPGRIGKQCRERWFNHLDPALKKGGWSEEEDAILVEAQSKWGNSWTKIAKLLPGRSENAVKNRWNSATRRRAKQAGREGTGNVPKAFKAKGQYKDDEESNKSLALFEAAMKRADAIEEDGDKSQDDDYSDEEEVDNKSVDSRPSKTFGTPEKPLTCAAADTSVASEDTKPKRPARPTRAKASEATDGKLTTTKENMFDDDVNNILGRAAFAAGWSQEEEKATDSQTSTSTVPMVSASGRPTRKATRTRYYEDSHDDDEEEEEVEVDENTRAPSRNAATPPPADTTKPRTGLSGSKKKAGTTARKSTGSRKFPAAPAAAAAAAGGQSPRGQGNHLYDVDGALQWEFNTEQPGGLGHPIDFLKVDGDFDLLEADGADNHHHMNNEPLQEDFHLSASLMNISLDKDIDDMGLGGMNEKRQLQDAEGRQLSMEDYTNHFLQQMNHAANQKAAAAAAAAVSFRERKPQDLSVQCSGNETLGAKQGLSQSPKSLQPLAPLASPYGVPPCSSAATAPSPTFTMQHLLNQAGRLPTLPSGLTHAKGLHPRSSPCTTTGSCRPMYTPEDEFLHSPTSPKVNILASTSISSQLGMPPAAAFTSISQMNNDDGAQNDFLV